MVPAEQLVGAVVRRTGEIIAALGDLSEPDLMEASALPEWTRLTIACHLRYGAEALTRMTSATLAGQPTAYYPEGRAQQRDATLRPRTGEAPRDVVDALATHCEELHRLWTTIDGRTWDLEVREPEGMHDLGPLPLRALALLRLTEVEVHGLDLALGLADWSHVFVEVALPFRLEWLNVRRSNHRAVDDRVEGSWLLLAEDGPTYLVSVDGDVVLSRPADGAERTDARIEGSSRNLLALLLGRPPHTELRYRGDEDFARAFSAAFPGP